MIKNLLRVLALLVVCGVFAGCGKKSAAASQTFANAAPEIREIWNKATADDQANDYVSAVVGYHRLMAQRDKLTPEQAQAVMDASLALNQRLTAAVTSGDAAAKAASEKLLKMQLPR